MARGFEVTTGLVIQQGLFELSSSALHKIGTRMQLADGRVFYYALDGGSGLTHGKLNMSRPTAGGHEDVDVSGQAAGTKVVTVTPATTEIQLANEYAEGFISIRETAGQGQIRKIKSHPSAASTDTCVMTLYDPWTTLITSSEQADLIHNPMYKVTEVATGTTVLLPAGIPLLTVTASNYFWNQTWGLASILQDGSCTLGSMVTQGTVAGSVQPFSSATDDLDGFDWGIVGVQAILGVTTKYSVIMLKIYP
jgi:hypothetical protein